MNRKRIFALGKLGLLFGVPVALVVGLFSCGVYCGSNNRAGITGFERDWLGMDVEVASKDGDDKAGSDKASGDKAGGDKAGGDKAAPDKPAADKPAPDKPAPDKPAPDKDKDPPPVAAKPEPKVPDPEKVPPEPKVVEPVAAAEPIAEVVPEPKTDELQGDLKARADMVSTIRLKVLVDAELIAARADWIDYVQRTVSQASLVYQRQFGITLELASVGRWPVPTAGMDSAQLLDDLRTRSREQSDVLVGLTDRPLDERVSGKAETPSPDSAYNGAHALVYANSRSARPHLRTLIHEISHTLGALDVTDETSADWRAKSWMSYARVRDDEAPWIDIANRRRILLRKALPFAPESTPEEDAP